MCGILGLIRNHSVISEQDEMLMARALEDISYRGPDNQSIWRNEKIILGHRRLSIIDLSNAANQPFHDHGDNYHLVFNGEIYNYKEIRTELAKKRITFRTNSDTETILELYKIFGLDFVSYLRGMFAIVIYDSLNNKLIFTRDRIGKKPLFYFKDDEEIIFSSEARSFNLFASQDINLDAVISYFLFQYVSAPVTIYKDVFSLLPGEIVVMDLDKWCVEKKFYWSSKQFINGRKNLFDISALDQLLREAVQYRLVADVEVGLLLSGGLDSSLIACYIKEYTEKQKIKAFNVKFSDRRYDESNYSELVAEALGFELIIENGDAITEDIFLRCISHCDQPLGDPALIPTYMISRQISKHLKVALSGEGADELFMGYDYYKYEKVLSLIQLLNMFVSPLLKSKVATHFLNSKLINRLKKINELEFEIGVARWRTVFPLEETDLLFNGFNNKQNGNMFYSKANSVLQNMSTFVNVQCPFNIDLVDWLPNDLLMKVDRMTMANSIEARTPFLDHALVEYLVNVPPNAIESLMESKKPIRKLLLRKLPGSVGRLISQRKKHGFEVPLDRWMKTELRKLSDKYFSRSFVNQIDFLDADYIPKLWQEYLASRNVSVLSRRVWILFTFLAWYDLNYIRK